MKCLEWLKRQIPELSPKRRELFATFLLNLSVASFAIAAFEGKWWGIIPGTGAFITAFIISRGL